MPHLVAYAVVLAVYVVLDQIWLRAVMRPRLAGRLGDAVLPRPRVVVGLVFGIFYAAVLTLLAAAPGLFLDEQPGLYVDQAGRPVEVEGWSAVVLLGGIVGLVAYGTRAAGNAALLRGWGWSPALLDTGWGMLVSILAALAGYHAAGMLAA